MLERETSPISPLRSFSSAQSQWLRLVGGMGGDEGSEGTLSIDHCNSTGLPDAVPLHSSSIHCIDSSRYGVSLLSSHCPCAHYNLLSLAVSSSPVTITPLSWAGLWLFTVGPLLCL